MIGHPPEVSAELQGVIALRPSHVVEDLENVAPLQRWISPRCLLKAGNLKVRRGGNLIEGNACRNHQAKLAEHPSGIYVECSFSVQSIEPGSQFVDQRRLDHIVVGYRHAGVLFGLGERPKRGGSTRGAESLAVWIGC